MITRRSFLRASAGVAAATAVGAAGTGLVSGIAQAKGTPNWQRLRRALTGDLVLPADRDYDLARQTLLVQWDTIRPQAVAYCETARDVRACLLFAQDHDIRPAVRSAGHCYVGWSSTTGLVVDVSRINCVARTGRSTAVVGPGAQAVDVLAVLAPHGRALPGPLCPNVGVGGYLSGGGIGWETRKFGVASDRLLEAEVVLADGRIVRCAEREEPDLFWAIRGGGGGNFGVVTRFTSRTVPARRLVNYHLIWPWDVAANVFAAHQNWLINGPDELSSLLTVVLPDAAPGEVPYVFVDGVWHGEPADLPRVLDELVADVGWPPLVRSVDESSYQQSMMGWYQCADLTLDQCRRVGHNPDATFRRENHTIIRGRLLSGATPATGVADLVAAFDAQRRPGQLRYLWLQAMGGQANRVPRSATAYVHRTTEFLLSFVAVLHTPDADPEDIAAAKAWADAGFTVVDRYSNGENYVNFPDLNLTDWRQAYYGENYARLVAVKRAYDPHNLFRYTQSIEVSPG